MADYPWRLAVGSIQENLDLLAASEEPIADSCAHKVRLLARAGFNRSRLLEGVALLLREVPWSSVPVEQAHASAAVLHRFHPGYSEDMLSTRATLHQCRHLFQNPELAKEGRAQKRLEALQRRNPEKSSGSHAFLGHLVCEVPKIRCLAVPSYLAQWCPSLSLRTTSSLRNCLRIRRLLSTRRPKPWQQPGPKRMLRTSSIC